VHLFANVRSEKAERIVVARRGRDGIWTADVPGLACGAIYAWSLDGPRTSTARFDPEHLLLDPAGWEIARMPDSVHGRGGRSRVAEPGFDWQGVRRPSVDPSARVVYELHVKGFTRLHPSVPEALRGSYAGLAHPEAVAHLKALGITTVELLPVHAHLDDDFLGKRGLSNYWGYNTLSWFAPHPAWSSDGRGADEFRHLVRELHRAGLEVVLDVVYNHSCEGGPSGPTTGPRGTGAWYRPDPVDPDRLQDLTGCGNTLDFRRAHVRGFVLDSLRHWVRDFGVDGFRFDLASVFGRMDGAFDPDAPFFRELSADPVLRGRLLIAEPWDATSDGYGVGRFPDGWMEWNDRFRDDLRRFWKGEGNACDFASRLAGSPDLYPSRGARASVNYAACHDGFTLRDLCTYRRKRNQDNGEDNRDGSDWNHSDDLGEEGESSDPLLLETRARRARGLLACALLARGTPMLLAGDEMGRTQRGNNNAYCQDNEISWLGWGSADAWPDLEWTASLLRLRREMPDQALGEYWLPEGVDGVAGVVLESDGWRRLLLARRGSAMRDIPLPPGPWRLRLDTSTDCGEVDLPWEGVVVSGGGDAFFVLDSPSLRHRCVTAKNRPAKPRGVR
jgi:glycogen debranching enzyme GlgX